jgi:hypothetical protein
VGDQGWVLADRDPVRALGPALAWGRRRRIADLHVVVDHGAGDLARRAAYFQVAPTVWAVDGDQLVRASPEPLTPEPDAPADIETLVALLAAADVDVVVEHGIVSGEVAGLEVARVEVDDDLPRLEVGVGRNDREAFRLVHGDLPTEQALATVVDTVRRQRRPGAPSHPLNRMAADRWLRAQLVARPDALGLVDLTPRSLTFARGGLREQYPAAALGTDAEGRRIVVVCSVGVDLDLVPTAADVRAAVAAHHPVDDLWLVMPERDVLPVTRALAESLHEPPRLVPMLGDWRVTAAVS